MQFLIMLYLPCEKYLLMKDQRSNPKQKRIFYIEMFQELIKISTKWPAHSWIGKNEHHSCNHKVCIILQHIFFILILKYSVHYHLKKKGKERKKMVSITCFFFHAVFCFCFYFQSKFRFINQKKYPYITILMSDHFGNANRSLKKKKNEEK